jgi:hypothetical protein
LISLAIISSGCRKNDSMTVIRGMASFPEGNSGDLANSTVSLYITGDNWNNNQPARSIAVSGGGTSVSYEIPDVSPGSYRLDIWKDVDNSGTRSVGDYLGWFGSVGLEGLSLTEFRIMEGQIIDINIRMYIITENEYSGK